MNPSMVYIFAIVFIVIAINLFFVSKQFRSGNKRRTRMSRTAVDEAKQALWRDKEVARRIEQEDSDAYERVTLRNETLALYEEVRRRHARSEGQIDPDIYPLNSGDERFKLRFSDTELEGLGLNTSETVDDDDRVSMIPFDDDDK